MAGNKETPKKQNILLRLLALLLTAALVLGALALVVFRDELNLDALKRFLTYRSLETGETGQAAPFNHAGGDSASFAYLKDGILLASSNGANYYSVSGESYAQEVLAMEHPVLSANRACAVAYDAGGQALFVFRDRQEVFSLALDGDADLLSARVNEEGWLAVTAQASGYKGSVTAYNSAGSEVIQVNLSSTFTVDAAVSPDSRRLAVVTMGQSEGNFSSQLTLYAVDQEEPLFSVSLGNTLVLDMDYESDAIWLLGESALYILDTQSQALSTYSFGRSYLKGCALGGDGFALVLLGRYRSGMANQALTIGPGGEVLASQDLSAQVLDFDAAGRYISLLTGSALSICTKDFSPYSTLTDTQDARYTALSDDGSALLADRQRAWLYLPG